IQHKARFLSLVQKHSLTKTIYSPGYSTKSPSSSRPKASGNAPSSRVGGARNVM
ncbi:hypothetical protein A2U01_0057639, partial [Trifolium medium]|nr:hypothetical protein [Trifolium medium]